VIAEGSEAGGHRGSFLADFESSMIGTIALVPQIVDATRVPVVASGGVMDGRGIAAALALGATAVQMGTAFLTCEEAGVSDAYKVAIVRARDNDTRLTRAFSGRPARGIVNRFMREPRLSLAAARRFGRPLISCNSLLPEIDHSTRRAHLAGCSGGQQDDQWDRLEDDERDRELAGRRIVADASVQERQVGRLADDRHSL